MSVNYPAREQERTIAFGVRKQTNISTQAIVGDVWRLSRNDAGYTRRKPITENDAAYYGKGHEWATEVGLVSWQQAFSFKKDLSAEIIAWASAFGLGVCTPTGGTGANIYTNTPIGITTGLELPYFTWAEQQRSSDSIVDFAAVGCVVEGFLVEISYGPGRAASQITIDVIGCGLETTPSGYTFPASTAEKLLPSASVALTCNGTDYVTLKRLQSLKWGWKNNILVNQGFYPGSGTDDGAAVCGRLMIGARVPILSFSALLTNASDEYTKLIGSTTGTCVITQTYDAASTYTATFAKVGYSVIDIGDADGLSVVNVECIPMYSAGVLTVVAKSLVDHICLPPA